MRPLLLSATFASLSSGALADDRWVVVGQVDHPPLEWDDAVLVRGNRRTTQLVPCGPPAVRDFAAKFNGFETDGRGSVLVVSTPDVLTRSDALGLR